MKNVEQYFLNLWYAFSQIFSWAMKFVLSIGSKEVRPTGIITLNSHSIQVSVPPAILNECHVEACDLMKANGWTKGAYEAKENTCLMFAEQKMSELNRAVAKKINTGKAFNIRLYEYTRDSDGVGHWIVCVNGNTFYDAYEHKRLPIQLSEREKKSHKWSVGA